MTSGSRRPWHAAARSPARGRARCRPIIGIVLLVILTSSTMPALAYWHSTGTGTGHGTTGTLSAPTSVSVPTLSYPNVAVTWTASTGTPVPTGYYVTRTNGTTVAACGTSSTVLTTATSCTDTGVPVGGPYTYQVIAVYRSWTATSAASGGVTVAPATKLAFTAQPGDAVAGVALSPSVAVTVETAAGAAFPAAGTSVTIALTTPGGATLSGTTTTTTNASGVATFSGLSVDKATSYTLTASSSGLTPATSNAFTITAAASAKFAFTTAVVSGVASATANLGPITVQEQDAFGNPVNAPSGGTTVTLASNTTGTKIFAATQNGTPAITTVLIASGTNSASFYYGDTKAATPAITASGSLTSATQTETVTAAAASQLAFGQQPTNTAHGATITPAITATILDTFGNQTTGIQSVTIAIGNNASLLGVGGALFGTFTHNAVAGIATFNGLSINGLSPTGTGYTLTIASTGLTGAPSNPFNIT